MLRRVHLLLLLGVSCVATPCTRAESLEEHARFFRKQLGSTVLPYWYATVDTTHDGYLLSDDGKGGRAAKEKQLVSQSRMVWGFSHAHRKGFSAGKYDYLKAAESGYRFLRQHFYDREHGGYFWRTDLAGKVLNDRKIVYGESFVIYALVEYYRASHRQEALDHALALYRTLQKRAHDPQHGGWIEHFTRDWQPILKPEPGAEVEVPGYKSANTHLHLMEALAELFEASKDPAVKESLAEAVRLNANWFYPMKAGDSCFHRQRDWGVVTDRQSAGLSYGHNVEFAWLMIRAQQVLGVTPAWAHFYAHLEHALQFGDDRVHGGLFHRGVGDQPATDTNKIWWVESEYLAALTDALAHRPEARYREALDRLIHFLLKYQIDPRDGIWYDTVTAAGKPRNPAKAHSWKANYHDVRGVLKFVEAWENPTPPPARAGAPAGVR